MPPLLYPLPTTSLLTFSNIFIDPSSSHTTALADATSARTRLQLALKAFEGREPGYSALAVVDEAIFPWKSSLTQYSSSSSPSLPLPSIHAEHLFVLLVYTLAVSNYAHAILEALPTVSVSMTKDEESRFAVGLTRAVDLLCQASGIADWAAENICPLVDNIRIATSRVGKSRWPLEVSGETFRGLSMTLLADAHLTAIRKLLLPILSHILFSPPGPPLIPKHPAPSLLAKLYLHVSSLYSSARALLKVSQEPSRKTSKDEPEQLEGEVIAPLKRYLRKESDLAMALGYKWLGIDAGENGKGEKVGEALAWIGAAEKRLKEMEDSKLREKMKGIGIGKANDRKKEERKARNSRVDREVEDIAAWMKAYTVMNDTVSFQPVPPFNTLSVPAGRAIFSRKVFNPPSIKFGPTVANEEGDVNTISRGNYF